MVRFVKQLPKLSKLNIAPRSLSCPLNWIGMWTGVHGDWCTRMGSMHFSYQCESDQWRAIVLSLEWAISSPKIMANTETRSACLWRVYRDPASDRRSSVNPMAWTFWSSPPAPRFVSWLGMQARATSKMSKTAFQLVGLPTSL